MATRYDEAIKVLNQVLVLQPDHSEARERLRVSTVRKNLMPRLYSLRQQAEENPQNSRARASLADAYHAGGMFAEADQEYLKALDLEPKSFELQVSLCVNYSEWAKLDLTVQCYKEALKQKQHHVLYMSLSNAYEQQGKFDEAIAAFQKSIELKPEFAFSLYGLGYAYIKQGRYEDAIQPLQKLISVEPKAVNGNHALGMAYARMGNKTAAMQQYYILQNLDARAAADLLQAIPK
jgi:tetratricopeptide (TPR) repeat protein